MNKLEHRGELLHRLSSESTRLKSRFEEKLVSEQSAADSLLRLRRALEEAEKNIGVLRQTNEDLVSYPSITTHTAVAEFMYLMLRHCVCRKLISGVSFRPVSSAKRV